MGRSTSPAAVLSQKGSHLPLPGSSSPPSNPTIWTIARGKSRQNTILRFFTLFAFLLTYLYLTSSPNSTELAQLDDYVTVYDDSLWSFQRSPRATNGEDDSSFTDYLNSHFPLDKPNFPPPYIWITLSDSDFMPGASNLDVFARQLNEERREKYGRKARTTVVVTLCLDEGCVEECSKRGMYCYGGYERRRPEQILKATWPKLASLIEILPQRDVFFIDADVAIRQDPYPHLEPLMSRFDILAQENNAFEHFNTGFLWMKQSQTTANAWAKVLEMDMQQTSRDQYNFNTVLGTTQLRIDRNSEDPYERPLPSNFTAANSLKVHILDQRLFRIMHLMEDDPVAFERQDSIVHHMTCADDKWVKLYIAKAEGFWSDLDNYYTSPRRLISIEHLSATEAQITQLFKIFLAAGYYSGRSVIPPSFATITDLTDSPFVARHSPSTFPLSHLERAFSIPMLEPNYIAHAQSHLLGRSGLDPRAQRQDRRWKELPPSEKQRRTDTAISLTHTSDIDLRRYSTFSSLVERLRHTDLTNSTHIRFVNAARDDEEPEWMKWDFSTTPVGRLRTCERLEDPWRCDEFCRGVEELKNGAVEGVWLPI